MSVINISGSTIGAIAVGDGAQAHGSIGNSTLSGTLRFTFEAKGATREQIARWLRGVALVLEDPDHPTTSFAKNEGGTSRAWALETER